MTDVISRLGVIGDVHAEDSRLQQALEHLADLELDAIVCTGDIVDGVGCPNESVKLLQANDVHTVRGNHDRWVMEEKARHVPDAHRLEELSDDTRRYLDNLPTQITLNIVHGPLLLCHGIADNDLKKVWPGTERMGIERSLELDEIIASGNYRYVINGHMHFRTLIHFETLTLINAGTLRGIHWPGFSMIEFDEHRITAYEFRDDTINLVRSHSLVDDSHEVYEDTQAFSGGWEPVRLF